MDQPKLVKILVVDDDVGLLILISKILAAKGYNVVTAEDGRSALEKVESERPDAVLLDIEIPVLNGIETLTEIKKNHPVIPVIMCSAQSHVDVAVDALKIGALDYITKPFDNDDILRKVAKALDARSHAVLDKATGKSRQERRGEAAAGRKSGKPVFIWILLVIACLAAGGYYMLGRMRQQHVYLVSYNNPTSIMFDGRYLWISDWYGKTVYRHNIDKKLSLAGYYSFPDMYPTGLAWGSDGIWILDSWAKKISYHGLDDNLSLKKTYAYPGSDPVSAFFDGKYLWVCDAEEDAVYKLLPLEKSLKTEARYKSPGPAPVGIFVYGGSVWTVDGDLKKVYRHSGTFSVDEEYSLFTGKIARVNISGAGWDGKNIWISAEKKPMVYSIVLDELRK
ncbi:MAG: response regulator [Elusimicrobia bacterium]|nr:response regulator [Elusimicrobiota bacterium]